MHVHSVVFGGISLNENESSLLVVRLTPGPGRLALSMPIRLLSVWTLSLKISAVITEIPITLIRELPSVTASAHDRRSLTRPAR